MNVLAKTAQSDKPDFVLEATAKTADDNVFAWDHSAKPEFKTIATICDDSSLRVFAKTSQAVKPEWKKPTEDLCGGETPTECPDYGVCDGLPATLTITVSGFSLIPCCNATFTLTLITPECTYYGGSSGEDECSTVTVGCINGTGWEVAFQDPCSTEIWGVLVKSIDIYLVTGAYSNGAGITAVIS